MDMLQQIALTEYHPQAHWHDTEITPLADVTDQHLRIIATPGDLNMNIETGTDSVDPDLSPITPDIGVTVIVILTEALLDHFISLHHSSSHHRSSSTYCYHHDTPHFSSSSCRHFSRDDSRSRTHKSNRQHYKPAQRSSSSSQSTPWKPRDRRHKQVTIDDPPSEYYSSDAQDSESEDDLN